MSYGRSTTVNRSPELLRRWREIGTVAANERAHETLRALGIAVHAAFMVRPQYGAAEFDRLREYVKGMPPTQCGFTGCTPSPGTGDYDGMRSEIWVDNPYDLHLCVHPLTRTALPLREYARRFGEQEAAGVAKTPMRAALRAVPPRDIVRVVVADRRYRRAFANLYRDYPRELLG